MQDQNNNRTITAETKKKPNSPNSDIIKGNSSSKPNEPKPNIKPVPTTPKEPKK